MKLISLFFTLILSASLFAAKISDDILKIGLPGSASDKIIKMGLTRQIRSNEASGKLEFTNDGSVYKAIGSGSGSGSGGFNNLDNAGFEDGITESFTCTATRCSALDLPNSLRGDKSLTFNPTVINDNFKSTAKAINASLYGRACESNIQYIGGDENTSFRVVNANGDTLAEMVLKTHDLFTKESLFYLCPSQAAVTGNSLLGDIYIEVYQPTATVGASANYDDLHSGELIGLFETALPDEFSATVEANGTITTESGGIFLSCTNPAVGRKNCDITAAGLTTAPVCVAVAKKGTEGGADLDISVGVFVSSTSIDILTESTGPLTASDTAAHIKCSKQGADAKQSVQVYKSIPKVAENVNVLSAKIANNGTASIISESSSFIQSVSTSSTGVTVIVYKTGVFTQAPVVVDIISNDNSRYTTTNFGDKDGITIYQTNSAGSVANGNFDIILQKQGVDFKMPTVQPVIVGQVTNSAAEASSKNIRVESCIISLGGGTPSTINDLCNSWIDSLTDITLGITQINYVADIFSDTPLCQVTPIYAGTSTQAANCHFDSFVSNASTTIECYVNSTRNDLDFHLTCTGKR